MQYTDPNSLLKRATELKKAGDINKAIETLRTAYSSIEQETEVLYGVDKFLRLPLYLHAAGRKDESLKEFQVLLTKGHPRQMNNRGVRSMERSIVYDKIRLVFQRDKEYIQALKYAILAKLGWIQGLNIQNRRSELEFSVTADSVEKAVGSLIKKSSLLSQQNEIIEFVCDLAKRPDLLDFNSLPSNIKTFLKSLHSA